MIFYGWGSKTLPLGEMGVRSCNRCGDFRPFRAILHYSYFRLYFLFGAVTRKKYIAACTVCNQGSLLEKAEAEAAFPDNPIPFMQRWGLAIFGLGVATVILAVALR